MQNIGNYFRNHFFGIILNRVMCVKRVVDKGVLFFSAGILVDV